ncbi:unnamed protein product [Aphanomyces euteiches]
MQDASTVEIVRSFYRRKPYFVQLRELEHDHALSMHLGGSRRSTTLLDHDKRRVIEQCSPELLEYGLLRFSDQVRQQIGMKLVSSVRQESLGKAHMSDVCRRLLKLSESLDMESRAMVVTGILDDLDGENRASACFKGLGPEGEARVLELILGRDDRERFVLQETLTRVTDAHCLLHFYVHACEAYRLNFLREILHHKFEYEFICDLAKIISTDQLEQLTDFVNGARRVVSQSTGLGMSADQLHTLLTASDTFPKAFTTSEQRRIFEDVCALLRRWPSQALDFGELLIEKFRSLHPRQRLMALTALLADNFHATKEILEDYFSTLSSTEKGEIQVLLGEYATTSSSSPFMLISFKEQLTTMAPDMRANVLYAILERIRSSLGDDDDISQSKAVKTLSLYCRELFGMTIVIDPKGRQAPTSKRAPTTTQAAAQTLEVLHQLDDPTRNTIIESLVQTIPAAPKSPVMTDAEAKVELPDERKAIMLAAISQLSLQEQIVSGLTEEDTSELMAHAMNKPENEFAKVAHAVISTLEATGQASTVEKIVERLLVTTRERRDTMTDEQRQFFQQANMMDKLSTIHEMTWRHAQQEVHNERDDDDDDSQDENTLTKFGMINVACQTDLSSESDDAGAPDIVDDNANVQKRQNPVTLPSLMKKGKGKKICKIDSSAVPDSLASLVTSWKINADQLAMCCKKNLSTVLRTIADTYAEKIMRIKRGNNGKKDSLADITYQSLLHSYGLPSIADMHIIGLAVAMDQFRTHNSRVDMFCQFLYNETPEWLLRNYLNFVELLLDESTEPVEDPNGVRKKPTRIARLNIPDKETWTVSMDHAIEVAQSCFRTMRRTSVAAFCEKLMQSTPREDKDESVVNVDDLLQLVVVEWQDEQLRREKHLRDAFRAGDNNGDGVLSYEEFRRIVLSIDKTRDNSDILNMFSDTSRRTNTDAITPEDFLVVAKEYGLAEMAWDADGDLNSIVNGLAEMDMMWPGVQPFFVGSIQVLERNLPPTHALHTCQGPGCGCLKCIVDGYAVFLAMREEATDDTQHAAAIWKRFWHLMSQLYEACDKSDGMVWMDRQAPPRGSILRSNNTRRSALPNILLPDVGRISAKQHRDDDPDA